MSITRDKAVGIVKRLQDAGHEAFLVGGCIRDELLGLEPRDFDITTSANDEQIQSAMGDIHMIETGKQFGVWTAVIGHEQFQIARYRSDGYSTDGRHPDSVRFVTTLKEDCSRRDFSINSMALDPISGQLHDYFNGQRDLKRKVVAFIGNPDARIKEDKLRILRALKFCLRYDFVNEYTYLGWPVEDSFKIGDCMHMLKDVSRERISKEFQEMLLYPESLGYLWDYGALPYIIPGIESLNGLAGEQDPHYHAEGNVWEHTQLVVDKLRKFAPSNFELLLAGLLHDIGKPATQCCHFDGKITNRGHDVVGAKIAENICRHWLKLSNDQTHFVTELVKNHMTLHHMDKMKKSTLMKWAEHPYIQEMVWLQHADAVGRTTNEPKFSHLDFMTQKLAEFKALPPRQQPNSDSIINGDHLIQMGLKPGPDFKTVLSAAREAQLAGEFDENTYQSWLERHLSCEVIA